MEKRFADAMTCYEKALRSLYHPGCRKDRILYRMARIQAKQSKKEEAYKLYTALLARYPKSLFCRSALYWLYKTDLAEKRISQAHHRLQCLLEFASLHPFHRKSILALEKELTLAMNLEGMERLKSYSEAKDGIPFHYYLAKMLEHDFRDYDRAIKEYEACLNFHPPVSQAKEIVLKIADLAVLKGDFIKAVTYLDNLLRTLQPSKRNFDLIIKTGDIIEDRIGNPEMANLFYENILVDYKNIPEIRVFAQGKIKRIVEKRLAKVAKPKLAKKAKREYSEEDQEIIDALEEIKKKYIDDLQDFSKAEREMLDLWDANRQSPASLEIMKALVSLNEDQLLDPYKAGEYYERWFEENPEDPNYDDYVMKLYDLYMEKIKDGQKALRLLERFINNYPQSPYAMEAQIKLGKANELLVRNWDEARRIYQRVIDTRRNDPYVHEAFFRMGFVLREGFAEYNNAIQTWEEMNNLFYNNQFAADAQYAIGFTYEAYLRDYTKARESYEKILSLWPNSPLQNQVREALLRISGKK